LDTLCEYKDTLEENLFARNYNLLNSEIDVVFYDVTTFAFQSVVTDGLRDFGFSKDAKFNEVQGVLGMFINSEGTPIGYDLFSGNTFDSKTLSTALVSLRKRFGIKRVIIVADRGINSKLNLKAITDAGYGYIVASRLKSMSAKVKELVLNPADFLPLAVDKETGEILVSVKRLPYTNVIRENRKVVAELEEDLLITHSRKRAKKDAADRQRLLDKARKLLEKPGTLGGQLKRGGRKYIKATRLVDTQYSLDQGAADKDVKWDGFYAIQSSERDMAADKLLEAYHTLWKIEESFRIMKSALEVRPVYHWTPDRIRGHFVVCFLAFLMERRLEQRLRSNGIETSPLRVKEALNKLTVTRALLDGETIYLKSEVPALAGQILKAFRIKHPNTLSTESQWQTWIER
jgi:transposase